MSPGGSQALGPAGVADGGGAPPPHIKARGAAGAHKAGRAPSAGREAGTEEGRAEGGREGGGRPGGLGCAGAARPLLT